MQAAILPHPWSLFNEVFLDAWLSLRLEEVLNVLQPSIKVLAHRRQAKSCCLYHSIGDEVRRVQEAVVFDSVENHLYHGQVLGGLYIILALNRQIYFVLRGIFLFISLVFNAQADFERSLTVDVRQYWHFKVAAIVGTCDPELLLHVRNIEEIFHGFGAANLVTRHDVSLQRQHV